MLFMRSITLLFIDYAASWFQDSHIGWSVQLEQEGASAIAQDPKGPFYAG